MGNSLDSRAVDPRPPELSALNAAEERSLTRLHATLFPAPTASSPEDTRVASVFSCTAVPDFGRSLASYILANCGTSLNGFLVLMAKCSRGRADDTIRFIWDVCNLCTMDELCDIYTQFFKLVLEFGNCTTAGVSETALVLRAHLAAKTGPSGAEEASVQRLIEWSHEYAPNMHRLLVTYLNQTCFPDVEFLSFIPFCPPVLEAPSTIVSQSGLLPLALYTTSCQGKWKCLYTTARDGISFNRVAHNILGYGVSYSITRHNTPHGKVAIRRDRRVS